MYTTIREILPSGRTLADGTGRPERGRVPRTVLALGVVSFFTDLSSEMVLAILPLYLTVEMGFSAVQYGIVDGIYQGVTAAVRIIGGALADLTRKPKYVALTGYSISCVTKLCFLPASGFAAISSVIALDRTGKGLRTAPRDAMIAAASDPSHFGRSFGIHRAMDTAGALGGPLIAFGVLAALANGYHLVFVLSFSLAAIGVAILALFVPSGGTSEVKSHSSQDGSHRRPPVATDGRSRLRRCLVEAAGLCADRRYRRMVTVGGLLSLATISDGFVYLSIQQRMTVAEEVFPLLFLGTALSYLVLAAPLGYLADHLGRRRVFLVGHLSAVLGYLALLLMPAGPETLMVVLLLVGGYYAATDGVLAALVAGLVPPHLRGTGIAGVQTASALGALGSAAVFGTLWSRFGQPAAVSGFVLALLLVSTVAAVLLRDRPTPAR